MEKQQLGKAAAFLALVGIGAFGLLAGATSDSFDVEAGPAQVAVPEGGPRECDLKRGIDTACTFL